MFDPVNNTIFYNGVRLDYVKVLNIGQKPVYDPSNSDVLNFELTLKIEALVYRGGDPTLSTAQLREMLLVPRRDFRFQFANTLYLQSTKSTQVAKGPMPSSLAVTKLLEGAWTIQWEITVPFIQCEEAKNNSTDPNQMRPLLNGKWSPIGSLRWRSSQTLDSRGYAIINYDGSLILRCPMEKTSPDDYRYLMTPKVGIKFRREAAVYGVSEDGMVCTFSFTDKEMPVVPPAGITECKAKFFKQFSKSAAVIQGAVDVHAEAGRDTKKSDLVGRALSLAFDTIKARGLGSRVNSAGLREYFVTDASISDDVLDNICDVRLSGSCVKPGSIRNSLPVDLTEYDFLPLVLTDNNNQQRGIAPALYGNTPQLRILAQLFNDPCLNLEWKQPAITSPDNTKRVLKPSDPQFLNPGTSTTTLVTLPPLPPGITTDAAQTLYLPETVRRTLVAGNLNLNFQTNATRNLESSSGTVSPDAGFNAQGDASAKPGAYEEYEMQTLYRISTGRYAMASTCPTLSSYQEANGTPLPTAAPLPAYAMQTLPVRTNSDNMTIEIIFVASKVGGNPTIPQKDPTDPNLFLLDAKLKFMGLDLSTDDLVGVVQVAGRYVYGVKDPSKIQMGNPLYPFIRPGVKPDRIIFEEYDPLPKPVQPTNGAASPTAPNAA